MSRAPPPWSPFLVLSERMMQVWCIRAAISGMSSEMWIPGTDVGIARNGPPVGAPGLGSQVSSWLEPPASQSKITRFWFRFISAASAGELKISRAVMSAAEAKAPAASEPKKPRRFKECSGDPQNDDRWVSTMSEAPQVIGGPVAGKLSMISVVESKFGTGQQGPEELSASLVGAIGAVGEILAEDAPVFVVGRARQHVADGQVDLLGRGGRLLEAEKEPAVAVGQQVVDNALAVAEEESLGDTDLSIAASEAQSIGERLPLDSISAIRLSSSAGLSSAARPAGSAVATRSEQASCIGVSGRTTATPKSDGRGVWS